MSKKIDRGLVENTSIRTPVVLLVDTSYSMGIIIGDSAGADTGETVFKDGKHWRIVESGNMLIDEVTKGVNIFYDVVRKDTLAAASCEIAIVSFNDSIDVLEDFTTIDKKGTFETPNYDGETMLAAGLEKALELLEERKQSYKAHKIDYHQPWLLVLTDGNPTDDISSVRSKMLKMEADKVLTIFTFALSKEVNKEIIGSLSKRRAPVNLKEDKLAEFFEWLGQSVAIFSKSTPGDKHSLDTSKMSEFAEWGDL